MYYVYLLQSASHPSQQYIGLMRDLRQRFKQHNEAASPHTRKFCPCVLAPCFAFADKQPAAFETILNAVQAEHSLTGMSFANQIEPNRGTVSCLLHHPLPRLRSR